MAIAFYTPPEYGPPPPPNSNPQQQEAHPQVVDVHQEHFQDANNNLAGRRPNVGSAEQQRQNETLGFLYAFAREVMNVFTWSQQRNNTATNQHQQRVVSSNETGSGGVGERERDNQPQQAFRLGQPHQSQLAQARMRSRREAAAAAAAAAQQPHNHANQQDNQPAPLINMTVDPPSPPAAVLDLLQLPSILPDIITCHAGVSVRYGSSHPISGSDDHHHELAADEDRLAPPPPPPSGPCPLSPRSSNVHPPSMDVEFSLKLTMCSGPDLTLPATADEPVVPGGHAQQLPPEEQYRQAGRQLRHIADSFRNNQGSPGRTNQSTVELNVVISVAIPTVAIIGLGIAYLRRH